MRKHVIVLCGLLLVACSQSNESSDTAVSLGEKREVVQAKKEYTLAMPKGGEDKYTDLDHGQEVWFAIGPITNTGDQPANGVAQAHYYADGTFRHSAQVNIAVPAEGYFYEGWLVHPTTKDFLSTGHLRRHFGDTRHYLQFEEARDLQAYTKVVITLEPDDGDPAPAEHVAEGTLVVRER